MTDLAFVIAPFRSGSTAVWSACRAIDGVTAFYEPLHEHLPTLTYSPRLRDATHDGVTADYFAEYRQLDRDWLNRSQARAASYAHTTMSNEEAASSLFDYVDGLARSVDGVAVLQFNRACLAIPTLASLWPSAPMIAVRRPAAARLASARDQEGQSFDWYETCAMHSLRPRLVTLAAMRVPRFASILARSAPQWFRRRVEESEARFESDAANHNVEILDHGSLRDGALSERVASALGLDGSAVAAAKR